VGRARKRARAAAATPPGALPTASASAEPVGRAPGGGGRALHDPDWRRAERRRIARLNRLPDPFRSWADRSRAHAVAVALLQGVLVIGLTLLLLKAVTGDWLPTYAAVVALAVAVAVQALCRGINKRADARAG
jgi:hypothetical protein